MQQSTPQKAYVLNYEELFSETQGIQGAGEHSIGKVTKSYYTYAEVQELLDTKEQ